MAAFPPLTRRGWLGALGASLLVAGCGPAGPEKTGPPTKTGPGVTQIRYAEEHPDQYGVLGLPTGTPTGLAILVHGGFWLDQFGAGLMDQMAADLRGRGFATWNVEYRRVGSGGGFPETFADIAAAFDQAAELGLPPGIPRVSLGHSAGGHLAVWAASRTSATPGGAPLVVPETTISLSGVLDLTAASAANLGNGAATALMGERPEDAAQSYALADPALLAPASGRILAVHATNDQIVPLDQSSRYVSAASAAGGDASLVEVPGGHFDVIDTGTAAWEEIVTLLPN